MPRATYELECDMPQEVETARKLAELLISAAAVRHDADELRGGSGSLQHYVIGEAR